jgi:hypothetical protein
VEILIAIVLLCLFGWFVAAPLLRSEAEVEANEGGEDPERADLEAAKEAKYRQIRDAELDREQGKLSQADWERADAELRSEAIEILKKLDEVNPPPRSA